MTIKFNFASRRRNLAKLLPEKNCVAIVPSAPEAVRNNDAHYPYRQSSDLLYLTGFTEPESVYLLIKRNNKVSQVLFCQPKNKTMEIWTGIRVGPEQAVSNFKVNEAYAISELKDKLPSLLDGSESVYFPVSCDSWIENEVLEAVKNLKQAVRVGRKAPESIKDVTPFIHQLRLIKDKKELSIMQKAGKLTARAHIAAMQKSRPGMHEYQLESALLNVMVNGGARYPAYESIVASGNNACILHYTQNNMQIKDGDLVLIDAGAELNHYAADITRTFPVNGKFTKAQKEIYQIVLDAQVAAIEKVKKGQSYDAYHQAAVEVIVDGLRKLKLLKGTKKSIIEKGTYKQFYMHKTGHWLGLDVHDVGRYKINDKWRPLEPGMVLTVEPGIYIDQDADVPERYKGIGVRIEDDVVVTDSEPLILTKDVPKTIEDIEALMAG